MERETNGIAGYLQLKVRVLSITKASLFLPGYITMLTYTEHIPHSEFLIKITWKRHIFTYLFIYSFECNADCWGNMFYLSNKVELTVHDMVTGCKYSVGHAENV